MSILLLAKNPYGEIGWLDMLKGEVITISDFDLVLTAATLIVVLAALGLFHKELLLVSFDREMAITLRQECRFLGRAALCADRADRLHGGAQRGAAHRLRLSADPGPDGAPFSRTMRQFTAIASMLGGATAFFGFWIAYQLDLPVGPTDVVLLGACYAAAGVVARFLRGRARQSR